MKYLILVITLVLQFISVMTLKLLDSFALIIAIFLMCLVVGGFMNFAKRESVKTKTNIIGWGLFYGSLSSLGLVILFTIWLSFNFPK